MAMVEKRRCPCCGQSFSVRPQNPTQQYGPAPACQRARKRAWQKAKRVQDADYRDNEARVQKAWRERHPMYWRDWRARHPAYVERNRAAQAARDRARRLAGHASDLANGDASTPLAAGTYALEPWRPACKCGRVTHANLFIIKPFSAPQAVLANEDS